MAPLPDHMTDPSILGATVLALFGGSSKVNVVSVDPSSTTIVNADERNHQAKAISDIILRLQNRVDVLDFLAPTDGVTDAWTQIMAAYAAAAARGKSLHFGKGTYYLSKALLFESPVKMMISSDDGAILLFRSSDVTLGTDAAYDNDPSNKRAGIYIRNAVDCTIANLILIGDDAENDLSINIGPAVSLYKCTRTRVEGIRQFYGSALINQTGNVEDYGTICHSCHSYASRLNSKVGSDSWFINCIFELPVDAKYDRTGGGIAPIFGLGSSQAIYWFASNGNVSGVQGCIFKNIRVDGIKVSGSAVAKNSFLFSDNIFDRCGIKGDGTSNGGVCILFGADDQQFHNHVTIRGLQARDCNGEIAILGARSVAIDGVHSYMSAAPVSGAKSTFISVARYPSNPAGGPAVGQADNQPVEMVSISNVTLSADPTIVGGGNVIAGSGISIADIGDVDSTYVSSVSLSNIDVSYCAVAAIASARCVAPTFDNIKATGMVSAIVLNGDRMPWLKSLQVIKPQSNNAQIKQTDVSWPIYDQLYGAGTIGITGNGGKVGISDNAGGTANVEYPLCGVAGFSYPTESKPEIVFAFGSNWTPAGTVNIGRCANDPADTNGTVTLTVASDSKKWRIGQRAFASPNLNASSPRSGTWTVVSKTTTTVTFSGTITGVTANDYLFQAADVFDMASIIFTYVSSGANSTTTFTTAAQLMACIAATTFWTASDYGSFRSPSVTTNHIRIRNATTSVTANLFYARSFCYRPTAGVFLFNSGSAYDRTTSRGENVDKFIIWTQCYKFHSPPTVSPGNVPAQTCMSVTPFATFRTALAAAVLAADSSGTVATFESSLITAINAMAMPAPSVPVRVTPVPDTGDQGASCTMTIGGMVGGAVGTGEEWAWRSH